MDNQGQGWLRGVIIAAAVAAAGIYIASRNSESRDAAGAVASTGRSAADAFGSSEVGKRVGRIAELLLGNVSNQAIGQVRSVLKDAVRQLDDLVDQI